MFNVPGKALIGINNYSPVYYLKQKSNAPNMDSIDPDRHVPLKDLLPRVFGWSDVVWIIWSHLAGNSAGQLKYIIKHQVVTAVTQDVMAYIAEQAGLRGTHGYVAEWPGLRLTRGSDAFKALIGTPHGKGIVRILVDHPDEFSTKTIESITIFTTDGDFFQHLLFTLSD